MEYAITLIMIWYVLLIIKAFNELLEIERLIERNEKLANEIDNKINNILKELTKWK